METAPYILNEFKPFTSSSTVADVKLLFNETTYSHFPIVEKGQLIGLISETDARGFEDDEQELGTFKNLFQSFCIESHHNLLEAVKVFASNEANLIPIVDLQKKYIGYYDLIDILHLYNDTTFLKNEGDILLIEKDLHGYSFSQICQIVESNKGKVLGIFISESTTEMVQITLKLSAPEVNEVIQAFRRYDYHVLSKHKEDFYLEDLKDRSDYLQKYLNI